MKSVALAQTNKKNTKDEKEIISLTKIFNKQMSKTKQIKELKDLSLRIFEDTRRQMFSNAHGLVEHTDIKLHSLTIDKKDLMNLRHCIYQRKHLVQCIVEELFNTGWEKIFPATLNRE